MRAEVALLLAALSGCAVNLDDGDAPASPPTQAPALSACKLLPDLDGLRGRVAPVTLPDGRELLLAATPNFAGDTRSAAFEAGKVCGRGAMALPTRPIIDVSSLTKDRVGTPRGAFTTGAAYVYFSLDDAGSFASDGTGIARFDPDRGVFVAEALLWTSDRPAYGSSALVDGDYVYVFGGLPARFLAADVYLARAPLDRLSEPAAYEYFGGGGTWAGDADLAVPLLEGGTTPSVVWHAASRRYLMAYATPLTREITLRSGLGLAGPWSRPLPFGACSLPFEQAFCGDVTFLPSLAEKNELALAHGIYAFDRPADDDPTSYWTQLVSGAVPDTLP
jgi:hypothetical protein